MRLALLTCAFGSLVACGSVNSVQPDAISIDADLRDADLSATVTVITQTHINFVMGAVTGAPVGMVDVFATRPNGTVGDMIQTDSSGHGMLKVYPGGSVTAIYHHTGTDMGADLVTYFGVKPGDTLTFGREVTAPTVNTIGTMNFSWPAYPGATNYLIYTPCTSYFAPTTAVTITQYDSCDRPQMDIVTVGRDATGAAIGVSTSSVAFVASGNATLTALTATTAATATVTNLPTEITSASAQLSNVVNGQGNAWLVGTPGQQPTGGAVTLMAANWAPAGQRTFAQLFLNRTGSYRQMRIEESFPISQTAWVINTPAITTYLQSQFIGSLALRMVNWFPFGPATYDGTVVQISWNHIINMVNYSFNWSFVTPPTMMALTMPTLPTALADFGPHPEDTGGFPSVRLIDFANVSGYDAFRAVPEKQLFCAECAIRANAFQRATVSN